MLVKFENKSNRVKGLAFHPQRPWILASLHSGAVQLWDYRMATLIEKFEEHDGPVRGVNFHRSQPLFVSGGDDYKIKVWNYQLKRCLFNLLGHLDYIRTVQFHSQYPWILSASDDQTIRIWNWQSRQCVSVLTGHNHYVMCAQFHPKEDLVLSASLDQSVRVWDVSVLRKKTVTISTEPADPSGNSGASGELFGGTDVMVKHVLEGHSRGVNWAAFHPKLPLIVSGADDREVKLWRMNERKAWEVDTMRGHTNNVSCAVFHPRREMIVSNSEDKTIRVWDMSKNQVPQSYRRENDRYWILDVHPTLNLLAAGHDSGLLIFKLERERPPHFSTKREVYYLKETFIRRYDLQTGQDSYILSIPPRRNETPRSLMYNTTNRSQHCVLLTSQDQENNSTYELYVVNKNANGSASEQYQSFRGAARSAVFISKNRFAILDRSKQVYLKDLKNDTKKKLTIPNLYISHMFAGGVGRLLLRTSDGMVLYDVQVMKVLGKLTIPSRHPVKYVYWSTGHKMCAMMSKANIYITDANMKELCSINETSRIKSGAWDSLGVFVYTTATHIKYLLPNGDNGIVRTLDQPIYLTHATSTQLNFLDRDIQTGIVAIDTTEYQFKVALEKRKYKEVMRLMQSNKLIGQSIISYLEQKGYPEVALHFVQDAKTRFKLALECGNIGVALECATELDDSESWYRLGVEALRQGNHQVVEAAYQKTKNFERLSFLYLITGNMDKLSKMLHIATLRHDTLGRFHNSLYLGRVEERVQVLRDANQPALAYATAVMHGLDQEASELQEQLGDKIPEIYGDDGKLFLPPIPILRESNWPLLEVSKGYFDGPAHSGQDSEPEDSDEDMADDDEKKTTQTSKPHTSAAAPVTDEWGLEIPSVDTELPSIPKADGEWGGLDGLQFEMPNDIMTDQSLDVVDNNQDTFLMPQLGKSKPMRWQDGSSLIADMVAGGNFDIATHLLTRQLGVANFEPFKSHFLTLFNCSRISLPQSIGTGSYTSYLERVDGLPLLPFSLEQLKESAKAGFKALGDSKLDEALTEFVNILHIVPLVGVDKRTEEAELKDLVGVCREYVTAMRLRIQQRSEENPARKCLLSAYFTHCKLQPVHQILGLIAALRAAFDLKNFKMAGNFARRILELVAQANIPQATLAKLVNTQQIRNLLKHCEQNNSDAVPIDQYKENVSFELCCESFTPILKGQNQSKCPYCKSSYHGKYDGSLCVTCLVSKIGAEASGLSCFFERKS